MEKMHVHSLLGRYFIMFERMRFGILFLQNRKGDRSLIRVADFVLFLNRLSNCLSINLY